MGVLNVTPDSFSDGGKWLAGAKPDLDALRRAGAAMCAAGAAILDVGGESTRPGAAPVSEQEELERVIPVIEALRDESDVIISIDTSTPRVMREAAAAGAGLINDVRGLRRDGAVTAAAATGLPVCLMHMQGEPDSMQDRPAYDDAVRDIAGYLQERVAVCAAAGIAAERILLDPGFGFGKTLDHNLQLLARLTELAELGFPLLVGLSRKSLIAKITGRAVDERLAGSIALALLAAERGAAVLRVHDVAETVDVLHILAALRAAEAGNEAVIRHG
uniref:dihydropteroate synthase n=1 Tax=Haliea sp. ETY-M TaxID=1055105 RepID=A0A455R1S4_9GAMM|nr:dihydropteroate synthase [Haliea sp. ETY-M]